MVSFVVLSLSSVLCNLLGTVKASFDPSSGRNLVVYWGQNSYGADTGQLAQQRLAEYCISSDLDIIPLAFDTAINGEYETLAIDFANANNNCTAFPGTQLLNCPQLRYVRVHDLFNFHDVSQLVATILRLVNRPMKKAFYSPLADQHMSRVALHQLKMQLLERTQSGTPLGLNKILMKACDRLDLRQSMASIWISSR